MKNLILFPLLFCACLLNGQSLAQKEFRGLYVDSIHVILGNMEKEQFLLDYLKSNRYNSISIYDLHKLDFTSHVQIGQLASLIRRARLNGVTRVGATAENAWFMANKIIPYNQSRRNMAERFNVLNFEFEYWNKVLVKEYYGLEYLIPAGLPVSEEGAFIFYIEQLTQIRDLAISNAIETEVYLGWFSQNQINQIVPLTDRILLHNYRPNPYECYPYSVERLQLINSTQQRMSVVTLFSAEDEFLGPWLIEYNGNINWFYSIFKNAYYSGIAFPNIRLMGQQWFKYHIMPNTQSKTTIAGPENGALTLFPNPATNYVTVHSPDLGKTATMYDIQGNVVKSFIIDSQSHAMDISDLSTGIYFVRIGAEVSKFIKQ